VRGRGHGLLKDMKRDTSETFNSHRDAIVNSRNTSPHRVLQAVVVHIEVGGVGGTADLGDVGGLARQNVFPIDA